MSFQSLSPVVQWHRPRGFLIAQHHNAWPAVLCLLLLSDDITAVAVEEYFVVHVVQPLHLCHAMVFRKPFEFAEPVTLRK